MAAFFYGVGIQWKQAVRNKEIFLIYYLVPLLFYGLMGGVFTSIMPDAAQMLIQSMTVFGVTMGAVLGSPAALTALYGSEMKSAYQVGGVPLWTAAAGNFIAGFVHLMIMSILIFFSAPILFDATVPEAIGHYFGSLSLFLAASLGVGTLFGLFVKKGNRLTMVTQAVFLPSIMLSGVMFPADLLPKALGYVGKLFPATHGYALMCGNGFSWAQIAPLLVFLAAVFLVCVWRLHSMDIKRKK